MEPIMTPGTPAKTTARRFNYERVLQMIIAKGKTIYGQNFKIFDEDLPIFHKLCCWFLGDEAKAAEEGINLHRGLFLTGPAGCGKTAIMRILGLLTIEELSFAMVPCHDIASEYAQKGTGAIDKYAGKSFRGWARPLTICFDDLGQETDTSFYADKASVMKLILPVRYDLFIKCGMITHVTTNLNGDEVEARYGYRIRSRIRQMFNVIAYPASSPDKR